MLGVLLFNTLAFNLLNALPSYMLVLSTSCRVRGVRQYHLKVAILLFPLLSVMAHAGHLHERPHLAMNGFNETLEMSNVRFTQAVSNVTLHFEQKLGEGSWSRADAVRVHLANSSFHMPEIGHDLVVLKSTADLKVFKRETWALMDRMGTQPDNAHTVVQFASANTSGQNGNLYHMFQSHECPQTRVEPDAPCNLKSYFGKSSQGNHRGYSDGNWRRLCPIFNLRECDQYIVALRVMKDVFAGLAQLESIDLVHMDITERNVVVNEVEGLVKLIDFGLAVDLRGTRLGSDEAPWSSDHVFGLIDNGKFYGSYAVPSHVDPISSDVYASLKMLKQLVRKQFLFSEAVFISNLQTVAPNFAERYVRCLKEQEAVRLARGRFDQNVTLHRFRYPPASEWVMVLAKDFVGEL